MRSALRVLLMVCLALQAGACGEPIAEATYQGEAKFRFRGRLSGRLGSGDLVNPAVGVVWLGESGFLVGNVAGLTPVTATRFPADFEAALFDDPPAGTRPWLNADFFQMVSGIPVVRGLRLGIIVAIDDVDKDGRVSVSNEGSALAGPDRFFGVARSRVVGYVDPAYSTLPYKDIELRPGFHLLDPCYSTPKTYPVTESIELEMFMPSTFLSAGARGTSECPIVLFPQTRGPLQQMLASSRDCGEVCRRHRGSTCSVDCGSETCLRLVERSRCIEARTARLACLAQSVTVTCPAQGSPDVDEGNCSDFNDLCPPVDPSDVLALSESPECKLFCERHRREMGASSCDDCATVGCIRKTERQPCVAAKRAQLACRAQYADNSECIELFSSFGSLCVATGQYDHLCPSVY